MFDVVSTSSGYIWSMNAYCPAPGIGPKAPPTMAINPGFAAELMLKDLSLSQQAAEAVDADTPMGRAARDLYAQFVEDEDGRGRTSRRCCPGLKSATAPSPKAGRAVRQNSADARAVPCVFAGHYLEDRHWQTHFPDTFTKERNL